MDYMEQPKDYAVNLIQHRQNIFSQHGEDGIIREVLRCLGVTTGWACEFGAWDGKHLSNTFNLIKNHDWKCVMIEGDPEKYTDLEVTAQQYSNIIPILSMVHHLEGKGRKLDDILSETEIPTDFDLLSIDVDSCDYHIWKSLWDYEPKVVVIEHSGLDAHIVQREGAIHKKDIDGSTSFWPIRELGDSKGYTLLCDTGNMIFLRNDLLDQMQAHKQQSIGEQNMLSGDLEYLGKKYGATKIDHALYLAVYEDAFQELRYKEGLRILEIGIDLGGSHKMWAEYFPNATIFGIDPFHLPESAFPKVGQPAGFREQLESEGIKTFKGNQLDRGDLQKFIDLYGADFDVIIDDAAHMPDAIQTSLGYLFPYLKNGGLYFVEDLLTAVSRQSRITQVNKNIEGLLDIPHVVDYHLVEAVEALRKNNTWISTVLTPEERKYLSENISTCEFLAGYQMCKIVKK